MVFTILVLLIPISSLSIQLIVDFYMLHTQDSVCSAVMYRIATSAVLCDVPPSPPFVLVSGSPLVLIRVGRLFFS